MKKRIGCLHAHYSNIDYIEKAFSAYDMEFIHFVDPGLMFRLTKEPYFSELDVQKKVKEQIEWIEQCGVDAILITCTNYISILQVNQLSVSVPVIKIDEPYFEYLCHIQQPQILLFTNPATVKGTVERLNDYAYHHQKTLDLEVIVIENTFELIMQGRKDEYNHKVLTFLNQISKDQKKVVSVAQLSMVDASIEFEAKTSITIINPLNTLVPSIVNQLG